MGIRIGHDHCPYCGTHLDAVTDATDDDAPPSPGDFTVCIECCGVLVFDDGMALCKADLSTIKPDEMIELLKAQCLIQSFHASRGRKENDQV
jgi:hypothetical protein